MKFTLFLVAIVGVVSLAQAELCHDSDKCDSVFAQARKEFPWGTKWGLGTWCENNKIRVACAAKCELCGENNDECVDNGYACSSRLEENAEITGDKDPAKLCKIIDVAAYCPKTCKICTEH